MISHVDDQRAEDQEVEEQNLANETLAEKIRTRRAKVGVIGMGYVGLPLAVEFAEAGFEVVGIDLNGSKMDSVNAGDSYIGDVPSSTLAPLVTSGRLMGTTDFSAIRDFDTVNICVPTPLRKTKDPKIPVPASVVTAFRSTRSTSPGRPNRPASKRVSSNWPAISTARCRTSW